VLYIVIYNLYIRVERKTGVRNMFKRGIIKKNKRGIATEILIRILVLIILFAIIGGAITFLLKRFGVL